MELRLGVKHAREKLRQIVDIAGAAHWFAGGEQAVARIKQRQGGLITRMRFPALVQEQGLWSTL